MYEVERILLILTPQKWGVIIVQKGKKNILIRLAVKRSKGQYIIYISK